jgi:hypothetical protein
VARPTIQKQISVPGYGVDYSAVEGYMRLVANINGPDAFGYVGAQNLDIVSSHRVNASSAGLISWPAIWPNSGGSNDVITVPAGTVYEVTVMIPGEGLTYPEFISVPDAVGPYWVQDILTLAPTDFATVAGKAPATGSYLTQQDDSAQLPNSILWFAAKTPLTTVTANYTILSTDSLIRANAAGGAFTVTLPSATGIGGRSYQVKRINSAGGAITIATTGGQSIDGSATMQLLQQYESLSVMSDNANWMVT